MNRSADDSSRLRAAVRAALETDSLEPAVRALLDLRFPAEGLGASLDEVADQLAMSPAMVAHIEFAALCAIAAGEAGCTGAAADAASGAL